MGKTGRTKYYHPEQPKKTGRYKNTNSNTGDPLAYIGTKVGLGIAGTVEGIGKLIEGTGALLSGNENYAKYVFQNSQVDEWRQDLDEQFNPDLFMQTLGAAGEGVGQSTTFLLNAAVPFLGTGMFFSGVVGNSIGNAVNMTGDLGVQEYGYGLTVGAAEAALEKLMGVGSAAAKTIATKGATTVSKSIGKAVVGRAARNGVIKSIVKESAGEFMEEFLGDYVDVTAQKLWGVNSNAEYSLSQALYSGLVGAISGATMGGTVELTSAARYTAAGQRVIRNGNVDALMRQANAVADAFGTNNTAWTQRGRMNQLIASIQASTDAYNALSDEAKQGARGAMLLGEIEGGIFGLQATRGVEIAADQILQKAEKFADYASKESGKAYTVEDLKANKDGILASLAVRKFAGEFMRSPELSPEAAVDEVAIDAIREREGAVANPAKPTEAVPFNEMEDPLEVESPVVSVKSIADSEAWDGESATFTDEGGEQTTILTNEDGTYDLYLGEMDEQDPDSNRLEGLSREQVEEILRERAGENENAETAAEESETESANEEIRNESANEADEREESEAVSEESQTSEEAAEGSTIEEGADSSEPVTSEDQEATETDEEVENTTEESSGEEATEESAGDSTEDVTGEEVSAEEVKEEQPPQKKRKTVASRSAASKTAQDGKLEDFGEKIGGARKDLWKETGLRASDVAELGEREAEKYVKKDYVWKRPDYKKLLADGADVVAIYWVKTVRDACPTGPYIPYAATDEIKTARREQFADLLQTVKNAVSEIRTVADLKGKDMVDLALVKTGWLTKVDGSERYSATEKGKNVASELSSIVYELRRTDERSLKRLASEAERKQFGVSKDDKIPAGFQIKFDDGSSAWLTPKGEERRPNTWYITHGYSIVGGAFQSKESALEWLKEKLAPKKKDGKSRFVPKQLERVHREGTDHRKNDTVDITGEDYLNQFGFRGGEYGNWVNQQERQTSLNYGYDALMDLAEALGISTTDISLGGTLAIAFGARGNGGAAAHYEPGQKVINLTKMKGAGSLAHEWFHALDDYMGTLFGKNSGLLSTDRGNTYAPLSQLIETMKYKNASEEQQHNHRKRQLELRKDGLTKTITGMLNGLSEEKKVELAERLVAMAESEEINGSVMGGPYMDAITKISEEKKAAVGRGIVKEDRETIYWTMYRYAQAVKDADQPLKIETDFYKGSKRFGALHARQDGYWESNEEMLARAFACYITDKINGQSDYLSGHSEAAVSFDMDRNGEPVIVKAIPEGDERIAINDAFDRLFAHLKENGYLNASTEDYSALGTAKYSLSSMVAEEAVLKGEKETQFTVSAETDQNARRASLASVQDRARKVVAQYDLQSAEVRYAIEEMYRSADEQGADPAAADAAAHLIAVLGDVEIRFDKGISKNGLIDTLPSGKRLILISPKTDAKGGAVTTLLHEATHYLEKSESYKQLSKVALESYPAEKAEEIRKRYRDYAKENGKKFSDEYMEQEVVAEAVGELLAKGKYIARMRNRSGLVNAITWLGRIAQGVVGKNREAHEAARQLWITFSKCLASTKAEAAEELRRYASEHPKDNAQRGSEAKYSYANADPAVVDFVNSVLAMTDKSKISKRQKKIGEVSDPHATMITDIVKSETGNDIDITGYSIWIKGGAIKHIEDRHGANGAADQTMSDRRDIAMIPWVVNHADDGELARNKDGTIDLSEEFKNSDETPAPIIILRKKIDDQNIMVVAECVPDAKAKRLYIISAYKESSSEGQVLNMESNDSPQPTSEVPHDGNATTDNSIPRESDFVKRKFSLPKSETAEERAERAEKAAKREKARADRLDAELHSYREYGINAGDVYVLANERMRDYNGTLDKNILRKMLLKATDNIAYLRKNPNEKNAAAIGRNIDKYIGDFVDEVIYHQKEELDPALKEMRTYMRGLRVKLSDELKGDLDRFGGYESFRRQNIGRGLILSKEGTPVESIYPELTARFGEAAFPSHIKNPADQLRQIAVTLKKGALTEKAFVDFDALARAEAQLIRAELTTIVRDAELFKKDYNPAWNNHAANGMNGAVVTYYTPNAARRIMNAADDLVKAWAEKNGASKKFHQGMRERIESEFLYLLNTAQKSDRADAAERLSVDLMQAQGYTKAGKNYTAKTLPDADARELFDELARLIRIKANAEENRMEGTRYARMEAAENAALREEVASLKSQMELAARLKSLLDLSKGRTKPSERVSLDEMNVVIEEFSQIVTKGRISPEKAQKFVLWLNTYLSSKEPTGTISYLKETINEGTLQILSDFATMDVSEPGAMGALQLKALNDLFFEIRHAYDTYGRVKIDGVWKDSVEIAQKGVADAQGSLLHLNRHKTLKEKLDRQVMQFMLQSQDPLRTAMMLEGYAEGGVLSKLIYDVIMGEAQRTSMQMEFLSGFEDFFKAHKGYQQKLATKMLKLGAFADQNGNPFEITLGEAMSLLGLSRREQAKAGLANSDIYFANDEEGTRMVQGGWARWADMDTEQRISMLTGGISEIASQMEEEDLQFFKMVEDFFNKVSSDVKRKADVDYFGHEMTMEDYYFPIYRDSATIAEEVADAAKRMQSFITVSNQSFNKQTMKNAEKSLYIANVYDVVTKHATGLATYATLYRPVLNFNTIWNQQTSGNKNSPESMRSVYQRNVWEGIDAYMKNLFDAVQGISAPKGPLSKVFSTVRGNAVFFQLGLNPKTWLTQWTSIIASMDVLSVASVQKGLAAGRKANDEVMDKYSIFARTRDYNMEVVKAEGAGDQIHKVGEWTMQPISKMDRMVIRKLWAACQYEVEAREGFAIDSEENNEAAGKLLDEVILRTQQTAGMATKSGYMRGGELEKSLTMFSSDAMKQLSSLTERMMRYQKYRADVKKGVPGAEEKLAESKRAMAKTGVAAMGVAVAGAMIAQLFKAIYDRDRRKKKDGTEVSVVTDVAADSLGNLVGILPLVRELYDMLDSGYEVTDFTLDAFNEIISGYIKVGDTVKSAVAGEYVPTEEIGASTRQFLYSTGMLFGIPTRNFNNILEGTLNVTSDELHWGYTSFFQKPSYQKDLDEAIENGDSALAELILETWLKREKVGAVGDELDVLMELYAKGYDFLPSSAPSKLNAKQRKEWMTSMEEIQSQAAQMVLSSTWQSFTEEAKADALKKLYRNRQSALKTDLMGEKRTKGALLSELYGYVPVAEISGMASAAETYEDEDGREITKRRQVEEVLSQYEGDEAILLYLAGYTSKEAKRILASKVLEIASTEEERSELYKLLGIDPEDL